MSNGSSLAVPSDKEIYFGGMEQADSKKHKTLNLTVNITGSEITAKQFRFGQTTSYLSTPSSSHNNITFGPGATLNLHAQMYAFPYPAPAIKFNGATFNYLGTGGTHSFIGQNTAVTADVYEIQSGGLTIDIPSGKAVSVDPNASALKGEGGITKTGDGSITWNAISPSSPSGKMTFTGPLVVSGGTWSSSVGYAASAFRAEGGTLALSGALEASSVALSATDGGTLTLSGATLSDASPDMTLASGGATDYFTRDGAVATYTFDTFSLGEGAILDLDADATAVDEISALTVNITATTASPAVVNLNFLAVPATGRKYTLFESDDAAKFIVNPKMGTLTLPHETAIENGRLVLTIIAEDYIWNGTQTNWGDDGAWTQGGAATAWADGNNAVFQTANASAVLAAAASPAELRFTADAAISGSGTLTVPAVSVAADVAATVSAPTAGALQKTGAGTLTLGASRTEQTTLSEGTLAMASGATVDGTKLTLGTDATKPVVFDYGGQTLTADPGAYLAAGMDVTLTNGVFSNTAEINILNLPANLTVAKDATLQTSKRFAFNTKNGETSVIDIKGGTVKSNDKSEYNWIMQASYSGRLDINVTDGGLLEFGTETYMLTCRDGDDDYKSPELHVKVVDSTFRVKNNKSVRFGRDDITKSSAKPVFTLAATNSVFDIAYGIYLGNDKTGLATEGSYTTEFNNCDVTLKRFVVYGDRTANNALFDGSTITFNAEGLVSAPDADAKWMTVAAGGLTLDTNGKAVSLEANLGGTGPVSKTGAGTLTVAKNQTSTGGFALEAGTLAFASGCTTFSRALSAAAGTTIDIPGGDPLAISLTLPAEGTVALTKGGAAFAKGVYKIFSGVSAATVQDKLVPSIGSGEVYSWIEKDGVLLLNVGNLPGNAWTGFAGDGKMSTDGNWLDGTAPVAGETIDFSGVRGSITIKADIDATFETANLGDVKRQITIGEGTLRLRTMESSMNDCNFSVAAGAKIRVEGDWTVRNEEKIVTYIVYENLGEVEIAGRVVYDGSVNAYPCYNCSSGATISAGGLYINAGEDHPKLNAYKASAPAVNWKIGADGLAANASQDKYFWIDRGDGDSDHGGGAKLTATSDFKIATPVSARQILVLDTGDDKKITVESPVMNIPAASTSNDMTITGTGQVVCGYNVSEAAQYSRAEYNGAVTAKSGATLAVAPGKSITTGAITMESGTTLTLPQSGKVALGGNLTLQAGSTLAFTLDRNVETTLDATGKTLTLPASGQIVVAPTGLFTAGKEYVLLTGANLADASAFALPAGDKGELSVDESGNLVYTAASFFYMRIAENAPEELAVPWEWITGNEIASADADAATVAAALAETGENGIPVWQSYCLGLNPASAESVVLCEAAGAGASPAGTVKIASNINVPDGLSGMAVKAYLDRKPQDGDWRQVASADVLSGSVEFDAPTDAAARMNFFRIRVGLSASAE